MSRRPSVDVVTETVRALGIERSISEAAEPEVPGRYVKSHGPEVNPFDHRRIVRPGSPRRGIRGTRGLWGRVLTHPDSGDGSPPGGASGRRPSAVDRTAPDRPREARPPRPVGQSGRPAILARHREALHHLVPGAAHRGEPPGPPGPSVRQARLALSRPAPTSRPAPVGARRPHLSLLPIPGGQEWQ